MCILQINLCAPSPFNCAYFTKESFSPLSPLPSAFLVCIHLCNHNTSGNNPSGISTQNGGGFPELHSRFSQMLRSMHEQLDVARGNSRSATHSSVVEPSEIAEATANTEEASPRVSEEGAFLSNVLRQIMPLISQNTIGSGGPSSEDTINRQASQRQVDKLTYFLSV